MKFKAILFDFDGTLVDSWPAIEKAMNATLQAFSLPQMSSETIRDRGQRSARESFSELFKEKTTEALSVFYQNVTLFQDELAAFPGAIDGVKNLQEKNIFVGVISNKKNTVLKKEWHSLGFPSCECLIGSGDSSHDKPHPAMANLVKKNYAIDLKNTLYVGDTPTDWEFAENSGSKPIAIGNMPWHKPVKRFSTVLNFFNNLDSI